MATPLAPISFCEKSSSTICNVLKWTKGLVLIALGSHVVLFLPNRLLGVDDPCFRQNLEILRVLGTFFFRCEGQDT